MEHAIQFWTPIIVAVLGSSGLCTLIMFFISRYDNRLAQARNEDNIINRIKEDIDSINTRITDLQKAIDDTHSSLHDEIEETNVTNARIRILQFSDDIQHGVSKSKEYYDQINMDIDTYRNYCHAHEGYKNNIASLAIANIERRYKSHMLNNDFLE